SWDAVLSAAQPGWEWFLRQEIAGLNSQSPADREVGIRKIKAVLDKIDDGALKDTYAELAGKLFGIRAELLLQPAAPPAAGSRAAGPRAAGPPANGLPASGRGNKLWDSVGYLLGALVVRPEALERVLGILDLADLGDGGRETFQRLVTALERGGSDALG